MAPCFMSFCSGTKMVEKNKLLNSCLVCVPHCDHFKIFIYVFSFRDRRRKGEREERNIDVREKHQSAASQLCPKTGLNLQPRHIP